MIVHGLSKSLQPINNTNLCSLPSFCYFCLSENVHLLRLYLITKTIIKSVVTKYRGKNLLLWFVLAWWNVPFISCTPRVLRGYIRSIKVIDLLMIDLIFSFTLSFLRNFRYIRYMEMMIFFFTSFQTIFCHTCVINDIDLGKSISEINTINSSVLHLNDNVKHWIL